MSVFWQLYLQVTISQSTESQPMCARFLSTFRRCAKFVLITSLAASTSALATDLTWTASVSTDWNNPTNWTPQQVPAASDHVIINSGSAVVIGPKVAEGANGGICTLRNRFFGFGIPTGILESGMWA